MKGTDLMVEKFIYIQNQEAHHVLVKQYKSNKNLDRYFLSKAWPRRTLVIARM